jgi:hypothetical protein
MRDALFPAPGDVQPSSRVQKLEVRIPGQRLRCACGHRIGGGDFYPNENGCVRAVCTRCHAELLVVEN